MMKDSGAKKGFSLMELILAIYILSMFMLVFIGMFTSLFKMSQKSVDMATSTLVAKNQLSKFLYEQEFSKDGLKGIPIGIVKSDQVVTKNSKYTYEITCSQITGSPHLKKVEISVDWWSDQKGQSRQGYGKVSTKLTRIVYADPGKENTGYVINSNGNIGGSGASLYSKIYFPPYLTVAPAQDTHPK